MKDNCYFELDWGKCTGVQQKQPLFDFPSLPTPNINKLVNALQPKSVPDSFMWPWHWQGMFAEVRASGQR